MVDLMSEIGTIFSYAGTIAMGMAVMSKLINIAINAFTRGEIVV